MTDSEQLIFTLEEVVLIGIIVFCFAAPAVLTVLNIINLFSPKKLIPRVSAMLTIWLGGALYALLLTLFTELYHVDTIGGFAVLFLVFGTLGIFILLIAAWNYPKERLLPSTVTVFSISFIAANLVHLAFALMLALFPYTENIFLMFYVYHLNLVLISVEELIRLRK